MQSLPLALFAGAAIGIVEQLLLWNYAQSGLVQVALFVIILVALSAAEAARRPGRGEGLVGRRPGRPPAAASDPRKVPAVRVIGPGDRPAVPGRFVVLPQFISNANSVKVTGTFGFIIIGLSVGIVTGLGGQLSLGQFALGAVGAVASFEVSRRTGNFVESFLYAGLAAAVVVSVVIGMPALRIKGLLLTVTTLSFALVVPSFILQQDWVLGSGKDPGRPILNGHALETGRSYYYVGLATLLVALLIARNVRAGGLGRRLVAVRDNEDAARAFTVPASVVKLQGFALAGFIAGIGGAMYGHSLSLIGATSFPTRASIDVVVMTVIGGIGLLYGPFLGAAVVQGATFLPLDSAGLAATAFGQLLIIMYLPGGGLGWSSPGPRPDRRSAWLDAPVSTSMRLYAAERGFNASGTGSGAAPALTVPRNRRTPHRVPAAGLGLRKSFGGVRAVRGVSFEVEPGETLGLIGPNGAGKTTTFELLAGFTKLDEGSVCYAGRDISSLGPEARGQLRPDPVLPGRRTVPDADGARMRPARAGAREPDSAGAVAARASWRREAQAAQGRGAGRVDGPGALPRQPDPGAVDRHPAHRRDRLPGRAAAAAAAARRAQLRHRPEGDRGARRPARQAQGGARPDAGHHRARHPADHGPGRPDHLHGRRRGHRPGAPPTSSATTRPSSRPTSAAVSPPSSGPRPAAAMPRAVRRRLWSSRCGRRTALTGMVPGLGAARIGAPAQPSGLWTSAANPPRTAFYGYGVGPVVAARIRDSLSNQRTP